MPARDAAADAREAAAAAREAEEDAEIERRRAGLRRGRAAIAAAAELRRSFGYTDGECAAAAAGP